MNETYEIICRFINWNKNTNIDETILRLMKTFTPEQISEAENYASDLLGDLRKAGIEETISEINGYYGDSVHDCMSELVAHGEAYVQQVIKNPNIAINRFEDGDYYENFFYCFPTDDDYDNLRLDHH